MGREARKTPHFVKEWREYRRMTQDQLAELAGIDRSAISKIESGAKPLMQNRLDAFCKALKIKVTQLYEAPPLAEDELLERSQHSVEGAARNHLASRAETGAADLYKPLTEAVPVIGSVRAGAWAEAYQLPEPEWMEMRLPADPRFAGVPRYGLLNKGLSMNRVCRDGGVWVFVRFDDLAGVGPQPGNYVIIERRRSDGLVEATAKRLEIRAGKPWLCPDTDEPGFEPFPLDGGTDTEEIRAIGLVTEIVNRV